MKRWGVLRKEKQINFNGFSDLERIRAAVRVILAPAH